MSIWDGLFGRRRVKLTTDELAALLSEPSKSGQRVNTDTTLSLAAAWACVRLRSRLVGALPMSVYERGPTGERHEVKDHWLYRLIHDSPNADQTASEFWGGCVSRIDLNGRSYALKDKLAGRTKALIPLNPLAMNSDRDGNGARRYTYSGPRYAGVYGEDDIFHLRGLTLGGDEGLSAVAYGRHSLGIGLAADETAAKTFANGLQVSGFIKMLQGVRLDKAQREELIDLFAKFTGSSRAGKVMPLDGGMEFQPLNMNPEDAQLLESRAFNIEEVCRWFDTPPMLIGHSAEGQTMWGSGIENLMLAWLTTGLDPLLVGIEQAVAKQLLPPAEQQRFYVEFKREALLRADLKARGEFYSKVFGIAGITANMIADRENLPRFEGGDERFVNSTLVPIRMAGRQRVQPAPGEPV